MVVLLLCIVLGWFASPLSAQVTIDKAVFQTDCRLSPDQRGDLRLQVNSLSFFRDNEFSTPTLDGYTLPGFWLQPSLQYQPLDKLRLEAGLHLLRYWGADRYPNMAYQDIAYWSGRKQKGVHLLPFFRVQAALSDQVTIVLGDLYGGANHQLIEPLYAPELNLTADPEAGLQLLYEGRRYEMDLWVNWQSFIFRTDTHQEAFTVGLSSRVKLNDETNPIHYYIPVQAMIQHRGGEIDTIQTQSVQTLMNGSIGFGLRWQFDHPLFHQLDASVHALGYYQQAGELWPFDQGAAGYVSASLQLGSGFQVKGSYCYGQKFISLYGYPLYGCVSTKQSGTTFDAIKTGYLGVEYCRPLAPGYAIGINMDLFLEGNRKATDATQTVTHIGRSSCFSAGIYLRIQPSFLLKKFQ